MAYVLEAFIAKKEPLEALRSGLQSGVIVPLPQDMAMLPVADKLRIDLYETYQAPTDGQADEFTSEVQHFEPVGCKASLSGPIAYVKIELFGGAGPSGCIVWEHGAISFGPYLVDTSEQRPISPAELPVNKALHRLGVQRGPSDEFDALRLGAHRRTDQWVEEVNK